MSVSVARKIAFDVLLRVESESAYASELLHSALTPDVKPADAALATEIALGVLRWRRLLDFLLDRHLKKPVARLDLPVAIALRVGLYQLRFLEKIPARAAVNESVELVKRARTSSAASLVNAVLRRASVDAKTPAESFPPPNLPVAERLAILHSHPTWMVERWLARFGESGTVALLDANNRPPRLTFAIHGSDRRDGVLRDLEAAGLSVEAGRLLKDAFAASGGSVTRTEAFRAGEISIQDEASQTIPLLLGVRSGDRVLDLCAAPGGKTVALARAAGANGLLVAGELHEHRLRAMRGQLARLRIATAGSLDDRVEQAAGASSDARQRNARVELVALDATKTLPFAVDFDRILVDAPCSGTGTLGRHPEIRWRLGPEQLAEFHALQANLLRIALAKLAPGGRLVYSTCSMEPEENESVLAEIADSSAYRIVPANELTQLLAPQLSPNIDAAVLFDARGYFRTSPAEQASDGFFAAVIEKSS
ncbi:MAG TPA: 16S rRNA (cytosine(967)-C(5))-methyltransferase RsmB [Candidatus Dormibacteraeota bacterium]|nr:16S rRNA (cytosine(967)-C(5))-methyltransferase RsmB [Candidatus Dormibacteraeota bacterium]